MRSYRRWTHEARRVGAGPRFQMRQIALQVTIDVNAESLCSQFDDVADADVAPELGGAPEAAQEAAVALLARCDDSLLIELATAQRLVRALDRARSWAGD